MSNKIKAIRDKINLNFNLHKVLNAVEKISYIKIVTINNSIVLCTKYIQVLEEMLTTSNITVDESSRTCSSRTRSLQKKKVILICGYEKGLCGRSLSRFHKYLIKTVQQYHNHKLLVIGAKTFKFLLSNADNKEIEAIDFKKDLAHHFYDLLQDLLQQYDLQLIDSVQLKIGPIRPLLDYNEDLRDKNIFYNKIISQEAFCSIHNILILSQIYLRYLKTQKIEYFSRQVTTHNACLSCKSRINDLNLYANKARQEEITNDLMDITR